MDGILPIWKEKGMTSHDVVNKVRRIFSTKRVGHGGTLDPDVEGVLIVAIGSGTRVLEYLLEGDKTYAGEITLGYSTTTEDASGELVEKADVPEELSIQEIDEKMKEFVGLIEQTPPLYSAVRVQGHRLYEYARANIPVERPSRKVNIYSFKRTSYPQRNEEGTVSFCFNVQCGKGTYVRTLAVDLGKKLGYPAHMSALTRTEASGVTKEQAITISELEEKIAKEGFSSVEDRFVPMEDVLPDFSEVVLEKEDFEKVVNGLVFPVDYFNNQKFPLLLTYKGQAIAIYKQHPTKPDLMKPQKVLRREVK